MEFMILERVDEKDTWSRFALLWIWVRKWSIMAVCFSNKDCNFDVCIALVGVRYISNNCQGDNGVLAYGLAVTTVTAYIMVWKGPGKHNEP
jgi:hypothetical protein